MSASTYSAKPFISHDAPDDKKVRAELKVTLGYGHVESMENSGAGKSVKVSFKVENTKFLSSGWAPTNSEVMTKVKEAKETGVPIHFRIETKRKDGIDRTTPMSELSDLSKAKDSIHKGLVGVRLDEDEKWTYSEYALTNPSEDPSATSGQSAMGMSPEELGKDPSSASSPSASYGFEPPPYVTRNNGKLNPGSMAVAVPLNFIAFLSEWDREHDGSGLTEAKKAPLAKALLKTANELQLAIYDGELKKPDLSAGSHTRARALIFETIRSYYPITQEVVKTSESIATWRKQIYDKSLGMWKWSMAEVESLSNS